jgi:hypothetical protein
VGGGVQRRGFIGDAVDTSCFQAKVILDRPKETSDLPR